MRSLSNAFVFAAPLGLLVVIALGAASCAIPYKSRHVIINDSITITASSQARTIYTVPADHTFVLSDMHFVADRYPHVCMKLDGKVTRLVNASTVARGAMSSPNVGISMDPGSVLLLHLTGTDKATRVDFHIRGLLSKK